MPTLSIQTDQNVNLDLITASAGERVIAALIDYAVIFVYYWLISRVGVEVALDKVFDGNENATSYILESLIFVIPFVFYDIIFETLSGGRSLGKMILKLRVVKLNGEAAGFTEYFIRWMFRVIDIYAHFLIVIMLSQFSSLTAVVGILTMVVFFPGLPAIISVARSKSGQRIGDMMAGTVITKVKQTTSLSDTILLNTKKNYKVVYKNALKLSDRDVRLIKETLEYYSKTTDPKYIKKLSGKAQEFLDIEKKEGMSDIKFLRTLMKDYNHLAVEQDGTL